jgi:hypothetical protein
MKRLVMESLIMKIKPQFSPGIFYFLYVDKSRGLFVLFNVDVAVQEHITLTRNKEVK